MKRFNFCILIILFSFPNISFGFEFIKTDSTQKLTLSDRLFLSGPYGHYICFQGQYSRQFSDDFVGLQLKKLKKDGEIGFSGIAAHSVSFGYGKLNGKGYFSLDANYHLGIYPLTLLFCFGAGSSITTNFNGNNFFSIYPIVLVDLGGIEFSYHYKFKISNSIEGDFSYHCFKVNIGLGFWQRKIS